MFIDTFQTAIASSLILTKPYGANRRRLLLSFRRYSGGNSRLIYEEWD